MDFSGNTVHGLVPPLAALAVADYCLHMAGPCQVYLHGPAQLQPLVPLLRDAGCRVCSDVTPVPGGLHVLLLEPTGLDSGWEAASDADIVLAVAPSATKCSALIEVATAKGWQIHPAAYTLSLSTVDLVCVPFIRRGIDLAFDPDGLQASFHGLAAALVRPGDAVLSMSGHVAGCWQILQQYTRCRWLGVVGNDTAVPAPGTQPVWMTEEDILAHPGWLDVLVSDASQVPERLEKIIALARIKLPRSGRLVMALPTNDSADAGNTLVASLEQAGFVLDRAWSQNNTCGPGLQQFTELPCGEDGMPDVDCAPVQEGERLVILAVRVSAAGAPYQHLPSTPNVLAFARDYVDPSTVRLIVDMGMRLASSGHRRNAAWEVLRCSPPSSADAGAALCVLLYDPVIAGGDQRDELLTASMDYLLITAANPAVLRWQVSLAFVTGLLHQHAGDRQQAKLLYERVLQYDVRDFSPLLGTKTTAAAIRLGWLLLADGEHQAGRQAWLRGMREACRLAESGMWNEVLGDEQSPETFGMPELTAVLDQASELAAALRLTHEHPLRPGLAWQWATRSFSRQLANARTDQERLLLRYSRLQSGKDWLDKEYARLGEALSQSAVTHEWLDNQYHKLTAALSQSQTELQSQSSQYRELQEAMAQCQQGKQWLEEQYHHQRELIDRMNSQLHEQERQHRELIDRMNSQLHEQEHKMLDLQQAHSQTSEELQELQTAAVQLSDQVAFVSGSVPGRPGFDLLTQQMAAQSQWMSRLPFKRALRGGFRILSWLERRGVSG